MQDGKDQTGSITIESCDSWSHENVEDPTSHSSSSEVEGDVWDDSLITQLKTEVGLLQRRVEILKRASITAFPNPIRIDNSPVGKTTLAYTFFENAPVEIHVSAPNGPLFARPSKSGDSETGEWVTDGMVFFLQDVSDNNPLTKEHTLASVTIRLSSEAALSARLAEKEAELKRITSSLSWRLFVDIVKKAYLLPVRDWIRSGFRRRNLPSAGDDLREDLYENWARRCEELRYDRSKAEKALARFDYRPLISIVMPVYNTPREYLCRALDSVLNQYYPFWELCICDDASTAPHVSSILKDYAARDGRIKLILSNKNAGIAAASNYALALASGEFIGLLDHDDEITPDALYEVIRTLQHIDADLIYSDEDKLDAEGSRCDPFFKPAWSPDLLLSCNYICHFGVYRKSLIDQLGGFREGFDGSQDYDLVLRFTEKTDKVVHLPKILYHWRRASGSAASSSLAKPYAYEAALKALSDALQRRGISASVALQNSTGIYRAKRSLVAKGKVSILIPTRDRLGLLKRCIESIEEKTNYENYEILIVNNASREEATIDYFCRTRHKVIDDEGAFNFSRLSNRAAKEAAGEYLLFLNNDVEVISAEWLSAMIEHAQRQEVGAVGAKLLYPDGKIQHAGVVLGIGGVGGHAHKYMNGTNGLHGFDFSRVTRNYSAVTGACLMMRRKLFEEIGGLDEENLSVAFNDVDLCLRLRRAGYLIVYTPYALLYHHESASRGYDVNPAEVAYIRSNWESEILNDPYYNPNLTVEKEDFAIDFSKPESLYRSSVEVEVFSNISSVPEVNHIGLEIDLGGDNFCAVALKFGKSPLPRKGTVILRVRHVDAPEIDLRVVNIDASSINDNEFRLLLFEPIADSNHNSYYLIVQYAKHKLERGLTRSQANSFYKHPSLLGSAVLKVFYEKQFRCSLPLRTSVF